MYRNDEITLEEVERYDRIILSPGPGLPRESGILLPLIEKYRSSRPMLGVCLGMQAMAEVYGGRLRQLDHVYHGVRSKLLLKSREGIFRGMPRHLNAGRYHSWVVDKEGFPGDFTITAEDNEGHIMAMEHKSLPLHAVQFHPESIMTRGGKQIIKNWLDITSISSPSEVKFDALSQG